MFFFIIIALFVLTDVYSFFGVKQLIQSWSPSWKTAFNWLWWLPGIVSVVMVIYVMMNRGKMMGNNDYGIFFFTIGLLFLFLLPKIVFSIFHLTNDVVHFVRWLMYKAPHVAPGAPEPHMTRVQFFNQVGLAASALMFGSMLYGVTRGKYAFRILTEKINFPDLPAAFDGMRIVQISDAHLGSFQEDGFEEVQEAVNMINELKPDFIFFTGDLVNFYAHEAEPWIETFSALKASHGKYSILGNHDYADYVHWDNASEKSKNLQRLKEIHKEMGFDIMTNENRIIEKDGERIAILGMENWGDGFAKYGDFNKTMENVNKADFKILLSHDPTHWEQQVMGKEKVHLTFSGHTHGAQFGLELPSLGIKFSPSEIRYKRWGGLYKEGEQYLYVNRGFGFLAFPGRVGMPPEITCIDLHSA